MLSPFNVPRRQRREARWADGTRNFLPAPFFDPRAGTELRKGGEDESRGKGKERIAFRNPVTPRDPPRRLKRNLPGRRSILPVPANPRGCNDLAIPLVGMYLAQSILVKS